VLYCSGVLLVSALSLMYDKHCLFDHLSDCSHLQTSLVPLNFVYKWNWEREGNWVSCVVVLSELKETSFRPEQLVWCTNSARLYEALSQLLHMWSVLRLAVTMLHLLLLVIGCTVNGQEIGDLKDSNWTNRSAVDHSERGVSKLHKFNFLEKFFKNKGHLLFCL
jgi:hypothetical protein